MGHEKNKYTNFRFPGQKPGEQIRLLIRKHWIVDVKIALTLLVIGFFPLVLATTIEFYTWRGEFNDTFLTVLLGFTLYFLVILIIAYIKWLDEELDIIIATDERIVSHEQLDVFHRKISEANIAQIQDVSGIQKGLLQSLLHFGTLEIQTSASDVFFIIKYVSKPYESARALLDLRDAAMVKYDNN